MNIYQQHQSQCNIKFICLIILPLQTIIYVFQHFINNINRLINQIWKKIPKLAVSNSVNNCQIMTILLFLRSLTGDKKR